MTDSIDFVVFSDDWGRHPSSCQHLFRRIRQEHRVLWVNTIGLRSAKADSFTFFRGVEKLKEWSKPLKRVHENMWVLAPIMLPVSGEGILGRLNRWQAAGAVRRKLRRLRIHQPVLFASVPTAIDYVGHLNESAVVYYITDDYSLWPGGNAEKIRKADEDLTRAADLVLPCSRALEKSHASLADRIRLLPHAVDAAHFAQPQQPLEAIESIPQPRAVFFGLIYEKIDLPLIARLAREMPDLQIVMIGPVKADTSALEAIRNVHFTGPVNYDELPGWLQACQIVVVPYIPDEVIQASGPLKIRECLALGKPTVVRQLPDLLQFKDVLELYDKPEDFVPAVKRALDDVGRSDRAESMRSRIADDTWEARVEVIYDELAEIEQNEGR